jgi:hypothetical protein
MIHDSWCTPLESDKYPMAVQDWLGRGDINFPRC